MNTCRAILASGKRTCYEEASAKHAKRRQKESSRPATGTAGSSSRWGETLSSPLIRSQKKAAPQMVVLAQLV
jgi:hypothetical protein